MMTLCDEWAATLPNFKFVLVISNIQADDSWQERTVFVHHAAGIDLPDLSAYQVYACGVPIVVESAQRDFVTLCKLPSEEFYVDSFTSEADLAQ